MWLKLYKLNNCFNDGSSIHLGLKYKGNWYALTHHNTWEGVEVPKYFIKRLTHSDRPEYLKRVYHSAPNKLNDTGMRIHKRVLEEYEKYKLDNLYNKRRRYYESRNREISEHVFSSEDKQDSSI